MVAHLSGTEPTYIYSPLCQHHRLGSELVFHVG